MLNYYFLSFLVINWAAIIYAYYGDDPKLCYKICDSTQLNRSQSTMRSILVILGFLALANVVVCSLNLGEYVYHPEKLTYMEALAVCNKSNLFLMEIRNEKENAEAYSFMADQKIRRMWMGWSRREEGAVHDREPNRGWRWERGYNEAEKNGVRVFWGPGEPNNNKNRKEWCGEMRHLKKNSPTTNWNDAPCDHLNPFICLVKLKEN